MATNPAATLPDADRVREAIVGCPFVVVSDCVRQTDTVRLAHVRLPAAAWGEKDGTVTNSERRISRQRAFLPLPGEALLDWRIVTEIARRMGFASAFAFSKPADIFREHCALAAAVGTDRGLGPLATLSDTDYAALPPTRWSIEAAGVEVRHFFHEDGRARLVAVTPRPSATPLLVLAPFRLNTGRYRDHWHTLTRTGRSPSLSRHRPGPRLELAAQDARRLEIQDDQWVRVASAQGAAVLRARISDDLAPGQVFAPMHWTDEEAAQARIDGLVAGRVDPISGQPESKATPVTVTGLTPAWQGFLLSESACRPEGEGVWWARSRVGAGYLLDLAGMAPVEDWPSWAKALLGSHGEWLDYQDTVRGLYCAAVLREGRVNACLFVGEAPAAAAVEPMLRSSEVDLRSLLAGTMAAADPGALVCACFGVGRRAIEGMIADGRARCTVSLGRLLKAGTNCGSCVPELEVLLAAHATPPLSSATPPG